MAHANLSVNKKEYIELICDGLTCSRKDKRKIAKELNNEIQSQLDSGETIESIIAKMGTPKELAAKYMKEVNEVPPLSFRFRLYRSISIVTLISMVYYIISKMVSMFIDSNLSNQVIGRADEPTVIFLSGVISPSTALSLFSCSFALFISIGCGVLLYKIQKHFRY